MRGCQEWGCLDVFGDGFFDFFKLFLYLFTKYIKR